MSLFANISNYLLTLLLIMFISYSPFISVKHLNHSLLCLNLSVSILALILILVGSLYEAERIHKRNQKSLKISDRVILSYFNHYRLPQSLH